MYSASEDELNFHRERERPKENRPPWANTPEVVMALQRQRAIKPEDIFGDVQPVKLEGNISDTKGEAGGSDRRVWADRFFQGQWEKVCTGPHLLHLAPVIWWTGRSDI